MDNRPFLIFKDSKEWDVAFRYLVARSPARSLISPTPNPHCSIRKRPSVTQPPQNGAFRGSRVNEGSFRIPPLRVFQVSLRERTDPQILPWPHQLLTSF